MARSVVDNGAGSYILKPVIRVVSTAINGSIKGTLTPALALPSVVKAMNASDTLAAVSNLSGQFLISGVPAGTYQVVIYPMLPYNNDTINNVNVTVGQVTDLGTIVL